MVLHFAMPSRRSARVGMAASRHSGISPKQLQKMSDRKMATARTQQESSDRREHWKAPLTPKIPLTDRPSMLAQTAEAWMNPPSQTLLIGDALKESPQLFTLLIGECGTKRFVVFVRNPSDVTQGCTPLVRQVKRVDPAVVRDVFSFHKPALLQLVDDRYQTARVHLESDSQILLA
jgi:hypothetical protein